VSVLKLVRRDVIRRGAQVLSALPLLSLAVSRAKEPESCSDPSSESLRTSLHYSDVAPNPAESCSVCGFFSSAADSPQSCGRCMIMSDLEFAWSLRFLGPEELIVKVAGGIRNMRVDMRALMILEHTEGSW
jgi:hypothetical protein